MENEIIDAMRGREMTAVQIAAAAAQPIEAVYEVLVRLEGRGQARLCATHENDAKPKTATWGLCEATA